MRDSGRPGHSGGPRDDPVIKAPPEDLEHEPGNRQDPQERRQGAERQ